jgi:hypothetical protein
MWACTLQDQLPPTEKVLWNKKVYFARIKAPVTVMINFIAITAI